MMDVRTDAACASDSEVQTRCSWANVLSKNQHQTPRESSAIYDIPRALRVKP